MSVMNESSSGSRFELMAIEPLTRTPPPISFSQDAPTPPPADLAPGVVMRQLTFDEPQYDVILRRQRQRPKGGGGLKYTTIPSRFLNLSNSFEFAGWGSLSYLSLSASDIAHGESTLQSARREKVLGQFTASALAGNAVLGSVFYALPAVFVVSGVYSPICLFVASLTLFLWRPIMEELAFALPISGAPYTYLINVSTKTLALVGAVLLLLDFASTAVVSAATAATYLAGEVTLPFPSFIGSILVLAIFTIISLSGLKESSRLALAVLVLHLVTMTALAIASIIAWSRAGNAQLRSNWSAGQPPSPSSSPVGHIARQVFDGICIGMLGLTGFECTPAYIARIKPGRFPSVLRNLHLPAIALNATMTLFLLALVPIETILGGANVLSILANVVAGRWLRIWVVVDAIIVLCGGVLTGILSACELLRQLACDRVIPQAFQQVMPFTGSLHVSVLSFVAFSGLLYASAAASLSVVSKMFSLVWLTVMTLFPLSLLLLKFNCGRLSRERHTPLSVIFAALAISPTVFAGNVIVDPTTVGYFLAYFLGMLSVFIVTQNKIRILRWVYWAYDQNPIMHNSQFTQRWGGSLIGLMTRLRRQPVCILAKTDEINHLFQMINYVRQNEETSCLKIVHFYNEKIPSEISANAKILDEAFPEITIDLILIRATFDPANVAALAHRLHIPRTLMFMSCPSDNFPYSVAELGTRIITL